MGRYLKKNSQKRGKQTFNYYPQVGIVSYTVFSNQDIKNNYIFMLVNMQNAWPNKSLVRNFFNGSLISARLGSETTNNYF